MPIESERVCVEPAPRYCYSQHTENQRHEQQPYDIRPFDVCEETCTRIRWFDPPASHGWRGGYRSWSTSCERFWTHEDSLYLTDVVMSWDHQDMQRFRGEEQYRPLWNPFRICTGCKTRSRQSILVDVRQWWSSRQQLHWMVTITQTFAQPSKNSPSRHLGHQTCNSPSNNYPHKSSTLREQARSETVDTMSQRHATHLSSSSLARNGSKKRFAGTRWS